MQAIALSTSALPNLSQRLHQLWCALTLLLIAIGLGSCGAKAEPTTRVITLQQQWTLNPGDEVAGSAIAGSLGDVSLHLKSGKIYAPFDGELEPSEIEKCGLYSTPEIPAYLFRLCGLNRFSYGEVAGGKPMGKGDYLSFATLRRQPDGTWIIVEPARGVLEKVVDADA